MAYKRFQNIVAESRVTLPFFIALALAAVSFFTDRKTEDAEA